MSALHNSSCTFFALASRECFRHRIGDILSRFGQSNLNRSGYDYVDLSLATRFEISVAVFRAVFRASCMNFS
jgi:hypothetical protein